MREPLECHRNRPPARRGFGRIPAIALSLVAMLLAARAALPAPRAAESPARDERPNVLFAIADDWSWPHAGAYSDHVVRTPTFDRVAADGVLFRNSFCVSPSCTPSRAAILTGQAIHRLEDTGNLWSRWPNRFAVYPDLLEAAGYHIGLQGKGWGPGTIEGTGRSRNPAGPAFKSFDAFLKSVPDGQPFCFWFGSQDPHRPYDVGSGVTSGKRLEDVALPAFLPDVPEVRGDILDYYFEVERFDRTVGEMLRLLDATGRAANTLVIITSDNGLPFPRAKANLYDAGTHMPLAVRWPARVKPGRRSDAFVSHADFAPTMLEAAGLKPPAEMTGRSLLPLLVGDDAATREEEARRDRVFVERERHANVRAGDLSYPARAIRTREFLYIRNFRPDRWPAGDPELYHSVGPFGDIDGGPSKDFLLAHRAEPAVAPYFRMACAKRPAEELFDLASDPAQLTNVADRPKFAAARRTLRNELDRWMRDTTDPRATEDDDRWDRYPYVGPPVKKDTP